MYVYTDACNARTVVFKLPIFTIYANQVVMCACLSRTPRAKLG